MVWSRSFGGESPDSLLKGCPDGRHPRNLRRHPDEVQEGRGEGESQETVRVSSSDSVLTRVSPESLCRNEDSRQGP